MVTTFLTKNAPIERINFWLNRNAVKLKYGDNYRDFNFKQCLAISTEEIDGHFVMTQVELNSSKELLAERINAIDISPK